MTKLYTDPFGPPWRLQWARMIFTWGGSIFQFFWIEWLFSTALCAAFIAIWYNAWQGKTIEQLDEGAQAFLGAVNYMASRFQAALSLMLGFYTSTIYGRWWKVRECEGVAIGRINDIAVQIAGFIRDGPSTRKTSLGEKEGEDERFKDNSPNSSTITNEDEQQTDERPHGNTSTAIDANDVRLTLIRWLNLSHALTVGELYEKKPNEFSSLEKLRDLGLLTDREHDYMIKTTRSRYVAPFVWFMDLLHDLKDREECGVSVDTILVFSENITKIRGSLADLYMYRNVPVPLAYRQLVNFTVRAYMLVLAIAGGLSAFEENRIENSVTIHQHVFWILLPFFFEYFMFVGWLTVSDSLGNPFRTWADEFEWENYVRTVVLSSNLFITESRKTSMHLDDLREAVASVQQKREAVSAEWEAEHEPDDDIVSGVHQYVKGEKSTVDIGRKKIRKAMTGY